METSGTLPAKLNALPEPWIERIFGHMAAFYGSLFLDRWKGTDLVEVKRVWASSLATFSDHPECFGLALKAMVDEVRLPPTLPEFVAICRRKYVKPVPKQEALPNLAAVPVSREEGKRRIAELKQRFPRMAGALSEIRVE